MMYINTNVFSIPMPPMGKMCKGFDGCFFLLGRMSSTSVPYSLLSFSISIENNLYGKHSSTLLESTYVVNLFFKCLFFDFVLFSYFKSYGLIFLILVNNGFFLWITCISNYFV